MKRRAEPVVEQYQYPSPQLTQKAETTPVPTTP